MNFEYLKGVGRCGMNGAVCQLVVRSQSGQKFGKKLRNRAAKSPLPRRKARKLKTKILIVFNIIITYYYYYLRKLFLI